MPEGSVGKTNERLAFIAENVNLIPPPLNSLFHVFISGRRKSAFLDLAMKADRNSNEGKLSLFNGAKQAFDILYRGAKITIDESSEDLWPVDRLPASKFFYMNLDPLELTDDDKAQVITARVAYLAGFALYNDSYGRPYFAGQKSHPIPLERLFWRDLHSRIDQKADQPGAAAVLLRDLGLKNRLQLRKAYPNGVTRYAEAAKRAWPKVSDISPSATDCLFYIFGRTRDFPRTVTAIPNGCQEVSRSQAQRGDLVFYFNKDHHFTHVGRVDSVGEGEVMINAKIGWTGPIITEPIERSFRYYGRLTRFFRIDLADFS